MEAHVRSYRKTIVLAAGVAAASATAAGLLLFGTVGESGWGAAVRAAGALLLVPAAGASVVALGGFVVMARDRARVHGREDLFLRLNRSRSEDALANTPRRANLLPFGLRTGDEVEILSREEIARTLDADGRLAGLPFMPEMERFCGTRARVFRRVDKIYDYGGAKDMRRLRDTVSLLGLHCDGSAHGGCQAHCYLLWKTAWLRRAPDDRSAPAGTPPGGSAAVPAAQKDRYDCQFTSLVAASSRLTSSDPRQDLRPLLAGTVTLPAFLVALLTRCFNWAQKKRGGSGYPDLPEPQASSRTPVADLGLQPGERVRVRSREEIAATLNARGRNRGLWFDADMLKYCGHEFVVERRVERIIDDATGRMLPMKTPCITLRGVLGSGEFLRFCPQHDAIFWREIWLERAGGTAANGDVQ